MERDNASDHVQKLRAITAAQYKMAPGEVVAAETVKLYLISLGREEAVRVLDAVTNLRRQEPVGKEGKGEAVIRISVNAPAMEKLVEESVRYAKEMLEKELAGCDKGSAAEKVREESLDAVMSIDPAGVVYGMTFSFLDFITDCYEAICGL